MAGADVLTVGDMFRELPVQSALLTLVPLSLAFVQLTNSAVNGLSFAISVPFALVMIGFAAVLTQHGFARFRRQRLERNLRVEM